MTRRLPHLLLLLALLPRSTPAQSQFDSLRGTYRILLLFTPTTSDPRFTAQQQLLENHASEISERDLIIIPVVFNPRFPAENQPNSISISPAEPIRLRSRYHIQPAVFTAILLGKDGVVKLRSPTPVTMEKLTTLIDSMPMRQQEVRDRHPN